MLLLCQALLPSRGCVLLRLLQLLTQAACRSLQPLVLCMGRLGCLPQRSRLCLCFLQLACQRCHLRCTVLLLLPQLRFQLGHHAAALLQPLLGRAELALQALRFCPCCCRRRLLAVNTFRCCI